MSEKKLIEYLLKKNKFKNFENKFKNFVYDEIRSSFKINNSNYNYVKSPTDTLDFIFESRTESFIKSLLIKYFNKLAKQEKKDVRLLEEDKKNLCKTNICNKLLGEDKKNFYQKLTYNVDTFIDITEVEKEFGEDFKNKKVEILYQYFYEGNTTRSINKYIVEDLTDCSIKIEEFIFEDEEHKYKNILNRMKKIKFVNCKFINIDTEKLIDKKDIDLCFEKCEIFGQFKHIFSKSIIFINCSRIDEYYFSNVSEDRISINKLLFMNCKITRLELEGVILNYQLFKNTNQMNDNYKEIKLLELKNCEIKKDFIIDIKNREEDKEYKKFKITKLDLTNTIFNPNEKEKAKVKIQFCEIGIGIFYNTSFYDLVDFYQTKFRRKVNFGRTDFFDISVFSECEFKKNVDFKYTKFLGKAIFRDTVIKGKLNLRDTIFDDEANFLDISKHDRKDKDGKFIGEPSDIDVENRETARVIKNFYDNSNNIIEANRFYKLEMIEREYELKENKSKHLFEWAIFKAHGLTSNHSQDWKLAFLWIMIFGLFSSFYELIIHNKTIEPANDIFIGILIYGFLCFYFYLLLESKNFNKYLGLICFGSVSFVLYGFCTNDFYLTEFAKNLNPFSIMKNGEEITFIGLLFKIIIAYLIYQLIISIRQNTRRK